jgi:chloramphenicol 3-O-phosphotransferase
MPDVLILTGPPGAGKSSVAEALAERYDRVAHIDVGVLRNFVAPTGRGPSETRDRLTELSVRNACALARNFLTERIAVIIDDVVITRADLDRYVEELKPAGDPIHHVRLLPSLEVCQVRNVERAEGRQPPSRVETVWKQFEAAGEIGGSTIDSSAMTAYEAADRLQALTTSGQSIVWQPVA